MALMWSALDRDVAAENEGSGWGNTSQRSTDPLGCRNWRGRRGETVYGLTKGFLSLLVPGHVPPMRLTGKEEGGDFQKIVRSYGNKSHSGSRENPSGVFVAPKIVIQAIGSSCDSFVT